MAKMLTLLLQMMIRLLLSYLPVKLVFDDIVCCWIAFCSTSLNGNKADPTGPPLIYLFISKRASAIYLFMSKRGYPQFPLIEIIKCSQHYAQPTTQVSFITSFSKVLMS